MCGSGLLKSEGVCGRGSPHPHHLLRGSWTLVFPTRLLLPALPPTAPPHWPSQPAPILWKCPGGIGCGLGPQKSRLAQLEEKLPRLAEDALRLSVLRARTLDLPGPALTTDHIAPRPPCCSLHSPPGGPHPNFLGLGWGEGPRWGHCSLTRLHPPPASAPLPHGCAPGAPAPLFSPSSRLSPPQQGCGGSWQGAAPSCRHRTVQRAARSPQPCVTEARAEPPPPGLTVEPLSPSRSHSRGASHFPSGASPSAWGTAELLPLQTPGAAAQTLPRQGRTKHSAPSAEREGLSTQHHGAGGPHRHAQDWTLPPAEPLTGHPGPAPSPHRGSAGFPQHRLHS